MGLFATAAPAQQAAEPADPAEPIEPAASSAVDGPAVAVLPFRVHSAKPIDYLGESLSNLLGTRLEASGRVRVVDPDLAGLEDRVNAAPSDAELRELAAALGAEYVVTGSLTELAGRYSLDVRVTPAALALRSHTLVLTAERDDELLANVNEVADAVIDKVVGAAAAAVAQVDLTGAGDLEETLRERLLLRVGEPYDPAVVRDDVAMLRGEAALANVSVDTERGPEGVSVRYQVVRTEQLMAPAPEPRSGEIVAEVRVRGNRRIEADAILARIGTRPGTPYQPAQIALDVREVYSLGFFRNIRVLTEAGPDGRTVIFEVDENPVVRQISISGNDSVDGDQIRDILTLTTGSTLDYPLLFENRERVEALYRAQGYYLVEVAYEIDTLSEHSVGIHFLVEENKKLKLRKISFKGNEYFTDSELREGFRTKIWRFWSYATSWFDHAGTYSEPLFIQDLRSVEKAYANSGYLQVEVDPPDVIPSPDGLEVSVRINEGRQFHVGTVDVTGDESIDFDVLRETLLLKEGIIFNRSSLNEDVSVLTEYYTDRGFYFANVVPVSNLSDADEVVDVIFQVRKGPLYFIREVDVSGNTITIDPVIRREVQLVEGQLYSQRQVLISRDRLERLGFFEEVDFRMEPTEAPEQLDLEVSVVERPTGSFSFGAGFSSQDGLVLTGSLSQTNLFGRGYAANASVDYGSQTQRFFLSFTDPYFLGSEFSLGLTAFRTDIEFEDFEQHQTGIETILGHRLSEDGRTRGFFRYNYADREIDQDDNLTAAAVIGREIFAGRLDSSLAGFSVVSDTRNDRLAPTEGMQLGATLEYAGLGGFANFVRVEARALWYLGAPRWMPEGSTFVVGTKLGYSEPFNSLSDWDLPGPNVSFSPAADGNLRSINDIDDDITLPLSERYFLGGLGQFQLRGFDARSVGPRRAILIDSGAPFGRTGVFTPVGRKPACVDNLTGFEVPCNPFDPNQVFTTVCDDTGSAGGGVGGNGNGKCNNISDTDDDDFDDLDETDVIGGNKFISSTFEYRFPISESLGLQGVLFFDAGNAFAEGDTLFDPTEWRYGTGGGVQWFSPFGPLAVIIGFPLDPLSIEDSPVFEFSVGGQGF